MFRAKWLRRMGGRVVRLIAVTFSVSVTIGGCSQGGEQLRTEESMEGDTSAVSYDGTDPSGKDPRRLVEQVVETVGGLDRLRELRDVEYRYTSLSGEQKEVSIERYVFDGELSWARYDPDTEGVVVVQGWDGQEWWVTMNDTLVTDPREDDRGRFSRKTNFYWLAMNFKLLDPGVTYEYEGTRSVGTIDYDLVRIGFGEGVGDAQDTYLLYINPYTQLVDRFLYTVMDYGRAEPRLKIVHYKDVEGVKLPIYRSAINSNWEGEIIGESWAEQISEDITFNNGFDRSLFEKPSP